MNTLDLINDIKIAKKRQNITTKELSLKSGVALGTLNKILSNKTLSIKMETYNNIMKVLSKANEKQNLICDNFGLIKVGAVSPKLKVADCDYNTEEIKRHIQEAHNKKVAVVVFPELAITGSTCGDLFYQEVLLNGAKNSLIDIVNFTYDKELICFVGMPLRVDGLIYNVCACVCKGKILAFVPKSFLNDYNEFNDSRYFTLYNSTNKYIDFNNEKVLFGNNIIFSSNEYDNLTISCEVGNELFAGKSLTSTYYKNNAFINVNLSASNELVNKAKIRRMLITSKTLSDISGYVYANAGSGESTTDLVYSGHSLIGENGVILKESKLFTSGLIVSDIDVDYLAFLRSKVKNLSVGNYSECEKIKFSIKLDKVKLDRKYAKNPFIDEKNLEENCELILNMQARGLLKRIEHVNPKTLVIGISGGLDSTLAILVAVRAFKLAGRSLKDIIAVTMPCFGTTSRTKNNAIILMEQLGVTIKEVNIKKAVFLHFNDIGQNENNLDVTYENAQARERTQVLMDIANMTNGLVVGTGDLSELALGWATYNGDHMSNYGVNASIPKTLVKLLVRYEASRSVKVLKDTLNDILNTPVSPELIPAKSDKIVQITEDVVGPYELHDFYLYYSLACGFKPSKILYIAKEVFKNIYEQDVLVKWLKNFYSRFFSQQFKRSCLPDGVKVSSISLSPRGDLKMPSDAVKNLWLKDLENM